VAIVAGEIKQVLVVRADLKMGKGKLAAQVAHASLMSYLEAEKKSKSLAKEWIETGEKKIVVKASGEGELMRLYEEAKKEGIPCALVHDAGLTQLPPNTITVLGIGPWKEEEIDKLTGNLKLV